MQNWRKRGQVLYTHSWNVVSSQTLWCSYWPLRNVYVRIPFWCICPASPREILTKTGTNPHLYSTLPLGIKSVHPQCKPVLQTDLAPIFNNDHRITNPMSPQLHYASWCWCRKWKCISLLLRYIITYLNLIISEVQPHPAHARDHTQLFYFYLFLILFLELLTPGPHPSKTCSSYFCIFRSQNMFYFPPPHVTGNLWYAVVCLLLALLYQYLGSVSQNYSIVYTIHACWKNVNNLSYDWEHMTLLISFSSFLEK